MKKKNASITLYIIALFIIFMCFSAFIVDGTLTFNSRLKLQNFTESAALAAAEGFDSILNETQSNTEIYNITKIAEETFNLLSKDSLKGCKIESEIDLTSKTVRLKTSAIAQPFFLTFLGVEKININADVTAQCETLNATAAYAGINWINKKSAYLSDILAKDGSLRDTAILTPLGDYKSASFQYSMVMYEKIDGVDNIPLSLGPGGFITLRFPAPIVDKSGYDLYIEESGSKEGYMVFVGIDKNPDNPYIPREANGSDTSDGISWINISRYGVSADNISPNPVSNSNSFLGDKIYGSAYFDLASAGLSVAKYIRIIDDNDETAYVLDSGKYYKTKLYGESSSVFPGADIDAVMVLKHVKLKR